jgi:hypothetical protein
MYGTEYAMQLPPFPPELVMNNPQPIPPVDTNPKRNPAIDNDLKDDGIQRDGYDLPIEGDKTESKTPQKTGAQDVKSALGG